jgi:UDP-N-acetylmuramoyl-L-alanyl-D-glutamate--2,6-diaminopimelate ligase
VYAVVCELGMDPVQALTTLSNLEPVEGRFNTLYSSDNITGIVDYAHTPDALENILEAIRAIMPSGASLITVVGCGGDRDRAKRPLMGRIASRLSHKAIFTSDNPRSEDPAEIIREMQSELTTLERSRMLAIPNREEALKTAVALCKSGDVVLVAGKGHEKYQEIQGVKYPFDDKSILQSIFKNMEAN